MEDIIDQQVAQEREEKALFWEHNHPRIAIAEVVERGIVWLHQVVEVAKVDPAVREDLRRVDLKRLIRGLDRLVDRLQQLG
jgi:hypothetical protein